MLLYGMALHSSLLLVKSPCLLALYDSLCCIGSFCHAALDDSQFSPTSIWLLIASFESGVAEDDDFLREFLHEQKNCQFEK